MRENWRGHWLQKKISRLAILLRVTDPRSGALVSKIDVMVV